MTRAGTREGIIAGAGIGILAAGLVLIFIGSNLPLLIELVLGLAAGAAGAYLVARDAEATRDACVRAGLVAGVIVGALSALAFTAATYELVNTAEFQSQLTSLTEQYKLSTDSLSGAGVGCTACFSLVVLSAAGAGLGALGGRLVGRKRPAAPPTEVLTLPPPQRGPPPQPPIRPPWVGR